MSIATLLQSKHNTTDLCRKDFFEKALTCFSMRECTLASLGRFSLSVAILFQYKF